MRASCVSVHGAAARPSQEVLQLSLPAGGQQDRASLRLPVPPLPLESRKAPSEPFGNSGQQPPRPASACRKRPFTTQADRLRPRLDSRRLPVAGRAVRRAADRGHPGPVRLEFPMLSLTPGFGTVAWRLTSARRGLADEGPPAHPASPVENAFFRYKSIIGDGLRARSAAGQGSEVVLGCEILNRRRHARYPLGPNIGRNLSYRALAAGCFSISSAVFFMKMLPDSFSVSAWK